MLSFFPSLFVIIFAPALQRRQNHGLARKRDVTESPLPFFS